MPTRKHRRRSSSVDLRRVQPSVEASAIVGVGMAADDGTAASEFFRHLPADTGMAFVVALPPSSSMTAAVLARKTPMMVSYVRKRMRPHADQVYVNPPNGVLETVGGDLRLMPRPASDASPIDTLFRSLARQRQYPAIGVLLSGTGPLGRRGLDAIRKHGGITFAEEMRGADFMFRPAAIARELAWIGRARASHSGQRGARTISHDGNLRRALGLEADERATLQAQHESLMTINDELENLLDSLDLPIVMVDAQLRLQRYSSSARRMVNLIASDIGRPLGDIRWNVSLEEADDAIRRTAETGAEEHEVRDRHGHHYALTIRPYRPGGGSFAGAVITLVDVDAQVTARMAVESELRLQHALTQALIGVTGVADGATHVVRAICEATEWPYGELWAPGADAGALEKIGSWSRPEVSRPPVLPKVTSPQAAPGRAAAERVWHGGEMFWKSPGARSRPSWQTIFACPIEFHGPVGVLVLFDRARRTRDDLFASRIQWILRPFGAWLACKSAEAQLRQREQEYRLLSGRLLQLQDKERRALAHELHDSTAQHLAALAMNLDSAEKDNRPLDPRWRRILTESRALAEQCADEVRTIAYGLEPPLLDEMGLASAVRWFASSFTERTGIRVEMDLGDVARMPVATERALFRVVQESLINTQRHARSSTASVSLAAVDGAIELAIRDKGHGLRDKHGTVISAKMGAGILGMRERVYQLGGTFEIQFTNRGTTVRVRVPLKESDR